MDTKLNNIYTRGVLFIICMYLFGITTLSAVDVLKNYKYIEKEYYLKSTSFKTELFEYFEDIKMLIIGVQKEQQNVEDKNDNLKIDPSSENIKNQVNLKQSLRYYIKSKTSNKIYTNIIDSNDIENYISNNAIYLEKFPRSSDNEWEFQSINNWFQKNNLEGSLIFIKTPGGYSQMEKDFTYYNSIRERLIKEIILGSGSLIIAISIFVFLKLNVKDKKKHVRIEEKYSKIPLDLKVLMFVLLTFIMCRFIVNVDFFYKAIDVGQFIILTVLVVYFLYIKINIDFILRLIRNKEVLSEQFRKSIISEVTLLIRECKYIFIKEILLFIATILFGALLPIRLFAYSSIANWAVMFISAYKVIYLIVVPIYVLKRVLALSKIIKGTDAIVSGDFNYRIEEIGDSNFIKISKNINSMKEGFKKSVESQVKSERLKTELISNVSHDLKTPLTAIINYVSLLKRDNISEEESKKYIDVLDQKSQRLKVLIEDLFEASKLSSGAIELNVEKVDIASLLRQALGELEDKIINSSLTFRTNIPAEEVYLNLDGKKTWRVFENLISNALKYSQPNSRVYIDVFEEDKSVIITIKNMSSYEMDFDVNEIFERFKRGDKARSSEGSGLGLSIAKSIVELQGGQMRIDIDGDLFKVVVEFKK